MISNKAEGARVRLGGSIVSSDREECLEKLHAALEMGEVLSLDLSGLTELDTAGVQILLCIQKEAAREGRKCLFTALSEAVTQVLGIFHLEDVISVAKP